MKISYNWLKDYLPIELPADEVSKLLTDIGLEVEELIEDNGVGNGLKDVVVGEVVGLEKHPDADRLKVTQVNVGAETLQIVCGASNVAVGQKVVVALVGSKLFPSNGEPFEIKKAKIRGVESFGMICAEDEIGLGESHEGIIVLPAETQVGTAAADIFGIKADQVFEIGLTPNRADAMGHIGVARDLCAAINTRKIAEVAFTVPAINEPQIKKSNLSIQVSIEDTTACPRYSGILIEGVQVAESPEWLQKRLKAVGIRPINNVVDITNYILAEYGQPLHAFDADKIRGAEVIVKKLAVGTEFKALDEQVRKLHEDDLMICDAEGGMCIAGVFGGFDSGVSINTKRVFLESACFNPVSIRKTAGRHNLRTDAAQKFEKGTDPNQTVEVLKRAVGLFEQIMGAYAAGGVIDLYPTPVQHFPVSLNYKNLDRLIGHPIERSMVKDILLHLGIIIDKEDNTALQLLVPPFKVDVQREADVIEEVLRIYGVNNIPFPEQMRTSLVSFPKPDKEKLTHDVATVLTGLGCYEIFTNSITNSKYNSDNQVILLNSLNSGLDAMRTSMLPTGLEVIAHNQNRRNTDLKLFEFGTVYHQQASGYQEQARLAIYLTGFNQNESWRNANRRPVDIYLLKSIVSTVLERLNIPKYQWQAQQLKGMELSLQITKGNMQLGSIGKVDTKTTKAFDIKQEVYFADLDWDTLIKLAGQSKLKYTPIPKFPGMRRDLALLLDKTVNYSEVEKIAKEEVKTILKSVHLFDKYEDARLGAGKKSYAVSYYFEDDSKTLTDEDIDRVMEKLVNRYKAALNAEIR